MADFLHESTLAEFSFLGDSMTMGVSDGTPFFCVVIYEYDDGQRHGRRSFDIRTRRRADKTFTEALRFALDNGAEAMWCEPYEEKSDGQ